MNKEIEEPLDGWYVVQDTEGDGWYWECWDNGKVLMACSGEFKNRMLKHPKLITAYEKYIKNKEVK